MKKRTTTTALFLTLVLLLNIPMMASAAGDSLRMGDKGAEVKALQQLLKDRGYFKYDKITGYFGKITEDAVRGFQRDQKLTVDGIAGSKTMEKLKSGTTTGGDLKPDSLAKGVEGEEVKRVQTRLKELGLYNHDKITGYYGPITEKAVRDFQEATGLQVDGICGAKTKEQLFSTYSTSTLVAGMRSDKVRQLQEQLKKLGYYTYSVTGFYGPETTKAVTAFQKGNGLTADGIAGARTLAALEKDSAVNQKDASRASMGTGAQESASQGSQSQTGSQTEKGKNTAQDVIAYAKEYLGKPYRSATAGPDTFDCTGFTCYVYKNFGITLPRSAYDQGYTNYGIKIVDRSELLPGDLLFFDTVTDGDLSDHAGIYIGDGQFIHAGSGTSNGSTGVKISQLNTGYYATAFQWARRVLD